jgi:hypothetical protein
LQFWAKFASYRISELPCVLSNRLGKANVWLADMRFNSICR